MLRSAIAKTEGTDKPMQNKLYKTTFTEDRRTEYNSIGVRALSGPMHPGLNNRPSVPPYSVLGYRNPVPLAKFQMAPTPSFLISSGSKKKEQRYARLSEAKASHSYKM
jgi:hypothetical protein